MYGYAQQGFALLIDEEVKTKDDAFVFKINSLGILEWFIQLRITNDKDDQVTASAISGSTLLAYL